MPKIFDNPALLADEIIAHTGKKIALALPLGLGKPVRIVNALVEKAIEDPSISLNIFTALTLEVPRVSEEIERRFMGPVLKRVFDGVPELSYVKAIRSGKLPDNIVVNEFFLLAGRWLSSPRQQQNYIAANYTHALRYVMERGVNVVAQLVAPADTASSFSLSCNPDLTHDLLLARKEGKADFILAVETNAELPYMGGDAEIEAGECQFLLDNPSLQYPLFSPPREPVSLQDHAIGLHIAGLVPDGGTLQIGIGSIGDAIGHSLSLRHQKNSVFRELSKSCGTTGEEKEPFEEGLYGASEMLVESFLDLMEAGVLKREVDGKILHAAFFLGSRRFYQKLRDMTPEQRNKIAMTAVGYVNELGADESKRIARRRARFINTAMMATLTGAVISDGLEDGRVVSGVGGQYNFVAQSFELEGARSIIALRATRNKAGQTSSNIVWSYGHVTIPRHLRDIVVTEYGVADLRGKTDSDVIAAMLSITDSRFQADLLAQAKKAGKIASDYEIPQQHRQNLPGHLNKALGKARADGALPLFPFGSDFTETEQQLIPALSILRNLSRQELLKLALRGGKETTETSGALARMELSTPATLKERFYRRLILAALRQSQA